ncbi:MAG: hypothetical protein J5494_09405 [Candidatus Methanomethylophilaceae archaeon]|nr:hypothetical protein [Candidatus Methanomethylophilaceae archaeon]
MPEMSVKEQLHHFPDDLGKALRYKIDKIDCDCILLCGMGGSAISGSIVADFFIKTSGIPLITVKNFGVPKWANNRTLAIVSSYSGNTMETLGMYSTARERGCKIIAITSGGILQERCEKDGYKVIPLPKNMQPRHSVGYMIGYTMAIMKACGLKLHVDICKVVKSLKEYRDYLESEDGSKLIERFVASLSDTVPAVVTSDSMQSVAFRWKTQINENTKFVAFCGSFSEYDCSIICNWAEKFDRNMTLVTIGRFDGERFGSVHDKHINVDTGSEDLIESSLRTVMFGDYLSMRMAESRHVNPEEVEPIVCLKNLLKKIS